MRTKGWQKIFGFTVVQYIKTKSFIVGTIIMCLLAALLVSGVNIIPKLIGGDDAGFIGGGAAEPLETVYISDEAGLLTGEDLDSLRSAGLALSDTDMANEELIDTLKDSERAEALVIISADISEEDIVGYIVKTYYSPAAESGSVDMVTAAVSEAVNYRNMIEAGVTPESFLASQRYIKTSKIEAGSDEWSVIESALNYFVPLALSMVLFMFIFCYGSTIAQSIATEKTSRVMELLLTSVRPLAIVIGKVLAMGLVSVAQFVLVGMVGSTAFLISAPFGIAGDVMEIMQSPELQQTAENAEIAEAVENTLGSFSVLSFVLIFVIFVLGFLFFALLAALIGASISRMEDLQAAMQPYSLMGVLGVYLAYFPVIFNVDSIETGAATTNPVQIFSYYFPVSSPFALPSALLLGTISPVQGVLAVLILAVFVVLIAIVVSKVYEAIILHNGNRIKFGDILKMAVRK